MDGSWTGLGLQQKPEVYGVSAAAAAAAAAAVAADAAAAAAGCDAAAAALAAAGQVPSCVHFCRALAQMPGLLHSRRGTAEHGLLVPAWLQFFPVAHPQGMPCPALLKTTLISAAALRSPAHSWGVVVDAWRWHPPLLLLLLPPMKMDGPRFPKPGSLELWPHYAYLRPRWAPLNGHRDAGERHCPLFGASADHCVAPWDALQPLCHAACLTEDAAASGARLMSHLAGRWQEY